MDANITMNEARLIGELDSIFLLEKYPLVTGETLVSLSILDRDGIYRKRAHYMLHWPNSTMGDDYLVTQCLNIIKHYTDVLTSAGF